MKKITLLVPDKKFNSTIIYISKLKFVKIAEEKVSAEKKPLKSKFKLSKRETQVLALVLKGVSNEKISEKLQIGVRTIDTHRSSILKKTKSKNFFGLIKYAYRKKLITL